MEIGEVEIDRSSITRQITLNVKVPPMFGRFAWRKHVALFLIRLGAKITDVNIEVKDAA